jgi:hypothetical protein
VASVIYAGRGARNHHGVHSIRLIHDYRNQDGNSWGSQEASPKTEAPLAVAKLSERCRASRYLSEVINVCHTSALNERVPSSQPPQRRRSAILRPALLRIPEPLASADCGRRHSDRFSLSHMVLPGDHPDDCSPPRSGPWGGLRNRAIGLICQQ